MKGLVFTEFLDMVEGAFGLAVKHRVIAAAGGGHDGAYTAVGQYDHAELVAMIGQLSAESNLSQRELMIAFGHHIFGVFLQSFGTFFSRSSSAIEFLSRIDSYIHVEVRKLYSEAELPNFSYPPCGEGSLIMEYRSPRPMAAFAEGLILATIKYYGTPMVVVVEDLGEGAGRAARFTLSPQPSGHG